jgi:cyclohexyl-isocyanide hydratase
VLRNEQRLRCRKNQNQVRSIVRNMEHLNIGALVYPNIDQADFTGPFEVLSRIPESTFHVIGRNRNPVRDVRGLILTPEIAFPDAPRLDVLVVPGGAGQEDLMDDEATLSFIRDQARASRYVFSVCTGALLCGASGLLQGVKATTHWAAFHLLEHFGAIPVSARVVVDGKYVTAAGVTAGLDGALRLVSLLRGDDIAQQIQLSIEYSPEPAFNAGSPLTAPSEIVSTVRNSFQKISERRLATARKAAARLGIHSCTERVSQGRT